MTRSPKGLGNTVYKLDYWNVEFPERINTEGPYAAKGAAKGRLTSKSKDYHGRKVKDRVLELTGEWVEVD